MKKGQAGIVAALILVSAVIVLGLVLTTKTLKTGTQIDKGGCPMNTENPLPFDCPCSGQFASKGQYCCEFGVSNKLCSEGSGNA